MKKFKLCLAIILCSPVSVFAQSLKPFTTDGCSAFPDGTFVQNELWLNCCVTHDYAYWKGGTYEERLAADEALQLCVAQAGEAEIAALMLASVSVGGTPYLPTRFRWGYGWPYPRGYKTLSEADIEKINESEKGN